MSAAVLTVVGPPATAAGDAQCISEPTVAANPTKILTIGDSLTSAAAGDCTWRYFLWKNLVTNGGTTARSTSQDSYQIGGLDAGLRYDIEVVPVRANIKGTESSVRTITARGTVNAPVPRPAVRALARHRLRITWILAADATRYQVRIRPAGGAWRTLGWSSSTRLTSSRLVKGRSYAVAVVAWDSYVVGRSSTSAVCRVR